MQNILFPDDVATVLCFVECFKLVTKGVFWIQNGADGRLLDVRRTIILILYCVRPAAIINGVVTGTTTKSVHISHGAIRCCLAVNILPGILLLNRSCLANGPLGLERADHCAALLLTLRRLVIHIKIAGRRHLLGHDAN